MIQATHLLELNEPHPAYDLLLQSAEQVRDISPAFAAQMYSQAAQLTAGREALGLYRKAVALLETCQDARLRAETWVALGQCCQEISSRGTTPDRGLLIEATTAYQSAIASGVSLEQHSDLFALAQNNLGLVYLAMPMDGDGARLRTAVAVQSFREALKVYDRERTPEAWVSTQLNLANALQYMHSAHPEENLAQAVEIYEELLEARPRGIDPLGHARLLANQANALAHLGIFAPALTKATEAHKLLHWHGEPDLAQSMLTLTEEINRRLAATQKGQPVVLEVVR
jgi:tetratricopeptide (TPR) repeat protein